nr:sigma factor [Candidatus Brachybacter algidus]
MPGKNLQKKDIIFENELLPHINALTTFAFHLTYNEEDARDLVQDTFLKSYKSIDSYTEGTNSKAWLFKILKNATLMSTGRRVSVRLRLILRISSHIWKRMT